MDILAHIFFVRKSRSEKKFYAEAMLWLCILFDLFYTFYTNLDNLGNQFFF